MFYMYGRNTQEVHICCRRRLLIREKEEKVIVLQNNPFFGRPNRFGFGNQNRNVQQSPADADSARQVMEQQQAVVEQAMEQQQAAVAQAMEQQQAML